MMYFSNEKNNDDFITDTGTDEFYEQKIDEFIETIRPTKKPTKSTPPQKKTTKPPPVINMHQYYLPRPYEVLGNFPRVGGSLSLKKHSKNRKNSKSKKTKTNRNKK